MNSLNLIITAFIHQKKKKASDIYSISISRKSLSDEAYFKEKKREKVNISAIIRDKLFL